MQQPLTFQDIILRLLEFWKDHGCLVQQPYNVQVGAGTMNPATVLRVLGPEPWNVVYVEPSIRPDDGRFGDNPNRLQMHHQLQVILQPDPGNPQELYLQSLAAIGIDPRQHDIRFVEDNWESPALGAWGLGWEVWLDGQEITQFTYFQQAGGLQLEPVAVELTYGLDRIALALQRVESVWEIDYGMGIPYRDLLLQSEIEHCQYYFHVADVEALREIYDRYEAEAQQCLAANLVAPAHDYNLKCSHLFNVLDTRGAIGVTERAQYFRRMRSMARQISELYVAQRHKLEHPFRGAIWTARQPQTPAVPMLPVETSDSPQPFLLEIGSEELPVADLNIAISQFQSLVPALLDERRLPYTQLAICGTPRRVAVLVHGLAPRQTDLETVAKGPPADRAYDPEGTPTSAALGFARGKGVDVADLQILTEGEKRYVAAVVREEGRPAPQVLAESLPDLLASIKFERSMRWNETGIAYSRPLRWIVALCGGAVIPFAYAGVQSGRHSRGLRPEGSPLLAIDHAQDYAGLMAAQGILLEMQQRQQYIQAEAQQLAAAVNGQIHDDQELLAEVANLVEKPTPLRGRFSERYLQLPADVLVAVMRKHQRYFPVYDEQGSALLPFFIAVRNGDKQHLEIVVDGNEQVLRARFADAEFFYNQDIRQVLADFLPELDKLTFQSDLGSMLDKVRRLEQLTPQICGFLGLDEAQTAVAKRAAGLSKADLATSMVVEMTALQGIIGGHYARRSGEPAAVAAAIAEQYAAVSTTPAALALAIADRLDSLAGLFAAGLAPKGSNDPFALRRAALHLIENLTTNEQPFDLRQGLTAAGALLPIPWTQDNLRQVLSFVNGRLEGVLRDGGATMAVVKAVLAEQAADPFRAAQAAKALQSAVEEAGWPILRDAYARCVRITRSQKETFALRPERFVVTAEKMLLAAYRQAAAQKDGTIPTLVASLGELQPAIDRFFDDVLVMDEDTALRDNRLALLQHIANLAADIADLSYLDGF